MELLCEKTSSLVPNNSFCWWFKYSLPSGLPKGSLCFFFFFNLFIHDRHTEMQRHRQRHRQREKQAPSREPDVGLHPGTPGPCPGTKAVIKPLSHPGILKFSIYIQVSTIICTIPTNDLGLKLVISLWFF